MSDDKSLVVRIADKYGVDGNKLFNTLKTTAFRQQRGAEPTNEQMMALLIVADQYGLNPFTREIFAFPGGGGEITPVVSVDGWSRIINEHHAFNGIEFHYSDTVTQEKGAKPCPEWVEAIIYRKDRDHPTRVREWLDEAYQHARKYPGPWQSHTKRMLRHKALIQCSRIAFGFAGIFDPDEAERIKDAKEARDISSVKAPANAAHAEVQTYDQLPDDDYNITEAEIIYEEISDERKESMGGYLTKVLHRAASAGAWAAALEHIASRYQGAELQYATDVLSAAELSSQEGTFESYVANLKAA